MKKKKFYLKLFISIVILCLLFYTIDLEVCLKTLARVDLKTFLTIVFIYITGQIISAKKWEVISKQLGFDIKLSQYIKYYFKGMFYNTFLPTNVGGDIMKVTYICKDKGVEPSIVSVLSDRLSGVAVLIILALAGSLIITTNSFIRTSIFALALAMFLSVAFGIYICRKNLDFNKEILKKCINYGKAFLNKSLIEIFILSLIFHILVLIIHVLIGNAIGLNINFLYYLVLYPLTAIAASFPISLNGIGIKEAAYVYLLKLVEIEPSQAIVFVLIWNLVVLASSLLGILGFIPQKSLIDFAKNVTIIKKEEN